MGQNKRVLIVDDDKINREVLKDILSDQYDIEEACNGNEAIDMINKYQNGISIILLDMIMPERNGYQVLEYMNEYNYIQVIPVIAITVDTDSKNEEKAFDLGVAEFIPKPFNHAVIDKRIRNTIDLYERLNNQQVMVDEQIAEIYQQA